MIAKRRQQDDEDDLSLFCGSPPEQKQPETEELDELGRVIPQKNSSVLRRERQAERVTRRSRRRPSKEEDGYSTDATLPPSDASDFQIAISNLATRVNNVLDDVRADDFKDPDLGVAKWFGDWRNKYSDTYTGAYGGLGMVSAWEFWVRLEIVGWDPMEVIRKLL
jgi:GC-rich sequence DNA-binding factor